jgi:hypothetical protein
MTALDAIARSAFGRISIHKRFFNLIEKLTSWNEKFRISLPQLHLRLEELNLQSGSLYKDVKERMASWKKGDIIILDNSPSVSEIDLYSSDKEKTLVNSCRYIELFYDYRNMLVHECREPGHAFEFLNGRDKPYYHSEDRDWELVFPIDFFAYIYSESLDKLEELLVREDVDPYSKFQFGSKWHGVN